ncbi:hypothetical protein [Selenomonas sp. F0473]|uniref:hypothetical protein n=1 Tax=Selenomonas sp. F0473 TaxID=999423 RepID=UPI0025D44C27|nr:hypothetical protein [Selenomonas sp. F0473]
MTNEWRVAEQYIAKGQVKYRVYCLRDASMADSLTNRTYLGEHHNDGGFVFSDYHTAAQIAYQRNEADRKHALLGHMPT